MSRIRDWASANNLILRDWLVETVRGCELRNPPTTERRKVVMVLAARVRNRGKE